MAVELRPLTHADAEMHCAGEDDLTVRWLTGGYGTVEGARAYFDWLDANAAASRGKRGFGVWLNDRLAGYVDCDPDLSDGLEPGDVNVSYGIHPWARGRGVAVAAVQLTCDFIRKNNVGVCAVIRVEPENTASIHPCRGEEWIPLRPPIPIHVGQTRRRLTRHVAALQA